MARLMWFQNPGNNGDIYGSLPYHLARFEFFYQVGWLGRRVEVRCLPMKAAVCWDDFEGAENDHSQDADVF